MLWFMRRQPADKGRFVFGKYGKDFDRLLQQVGQSSG
jgi:uracil-DNA glycosylase